MEGRKRGEVLKERGGRSATRLKQQHACTRREEHEHRHLRRRNEHEAALGTALGGSRERGGAGVRSARGTGGRAEGTHSDTRVVTRLLGEAVEAIGGDQLDVD